jgi:tetratricopeptide (TPR) repeat protein
MSLETNAARSPHRAVSSRCGAAWRRVAAAAALAAFAAFGEAHADDDAAASLDNSSLDAPLFYQLLIGEIELRSGESGAAYEVILDAARRTKDEAVFRRAVDIALQGRAGDQALAATRAWRNALPASLDALRMQLQILAALNRLSDAAEPLRALLAQTPAEERGGLIAALPRFLQRGADTRATAQLLDDVLGPYVKDKATRVQAQVAVGRGWLQAGDGARALELAQQAQRDEAAAPGPALLALDLMATRPEAEAIVTSFLQQPGVDSGMRLAYVRTLTNLQRYPEAVTQLERVTKDKPELAAPYLSLGALYLELKRGRDGDAALLKYLDLAKAGKTAPAPAAAASAADDDGDEEEAPQRSDQGVTQAYLLLSQSAEQRGDYKAAESWLAKVDDPQRALDVQTRRASMLARQGRVDEARALIRKLPERGDEEARSKLVAEAGILRDVKRWKEAYDVLGSAVQRFPQDTDLLYEQAMMAEKLERLDEMERLLKRVIELKPDSAQAYNALGYSLADRRVRLPEARTLIAKALELAPGDPFITDSMGWVEYRLGRHDEALALLRKAYAARPDTEIAAHLGEVLWSFGQREEARKVWQEAKGRDAANDVLRETLSRLKVGL